MSLRRAAGILANSLKQQLGNSGVRNIHTSGPALGEGGISGVYKGEVQFSCIGAALNLFLCTFVLFINMYI